VALSGCLLPVGGVVIIPDIPEGVGAPDMVGGILQDGGVDIPYLTAIQQEQLLYSWLMKKHLEQVTWKIW